MSEHEFVAKRVQRMSDNDHCTPVELLKTVLHEIETGEAHVDNMMIITVDRRGEGWIVNRFRAKLTRETEIALLTTSQYKAIRDWVE